MELWEDKPRHVLSNEIKGCIFWPFCILSVLDQGRGFSETTNSIGINDTSLYTGSWTEWDVIARPDGWQPSASIHYLR